MVELDIAWGDDIGSVGIGKDKVSFAPAVKVYTRLGGGDKVGVGDIGDGVVIEHIAHRQVHIGGIHDSHGVGDAGPWVQLPCVHDGFHVLRGLRRGWHAEETAYNNYAEATTTHYVGNVMTHTDTSPIYIGVQRYNKKCTFARKSHESLLSNAIFLQMGCIVWQ